MLTHEQDKPLLLMCWSDHSLPFAPLPAVCPHTQSPYFSVPICFLTEHYQLMKGSTHFHLPIPCGFCQNFGDSLP